MDVIRFNDKINIDLSLFQGKTIIELFDALGKNIFDEILEVKGNENIVIETENLKQGMYMIRVSDNISVKTQKIIVQH